MQTLTMALYLGGHLSVASPARVVQRTPEGTLLWLVAGAPIWEAVLPDGGHLRDVLPEKRPAEGYPLRVGEWRPPSNLVYQPAGAAHAVWWLFSTELDFEGWYVNLERRRSRGDDIDVVDHELDIVVEPNGEWRWKDEESFAAKVGHPAYWTSEEASEIRAEGERVGRRIEAGRFPFDGSWCDFTPPATWETPGLPAAPPRFLGG
ncbi:DUF402 domain-containing protein [Nonomuraea sp. NPDC005983]|uniref:DUF402 domain-containing protein n=1 Tax=Nonomuraea sp. NPDC005983 TaxID=3155595 RepID=UPI0033BC7811